jgi:hypothetical protein
MDDKLKALNVPYHFLAMFVGFVDGDGYIQIVKDRSYIKVNLVIGLHGKDLKLLQSFHNILGIGRVDTSSSDGTVKFIVSRAELQEVLIPLLLHHNLFFITHNRRQQFDLLMFIMSNDIRHWDNVPSSVPIVSPDLPSSPEGYTSLPFFPNWLVGFTMAEGSFHHKKNGDSCFSLKQNNIGDHSILFAALKLFFGTRTKIDTSSGHLKLNVSSVKDLQSVITFFSFSPNNYPLSGHKAIQYDSWLADLKVIPRYSSKLDFPTS